MLQMLYVKIFLMSSSLIGITTAVHVKLNCVIGINVRMTWFQTFSHKFGETPIKNTKPVKRTNKQAIAKKKNDQSNKNDQKKK